MHSDTINIMFICIHMTVHYGPVGHVRAFPDFRSKLFRYGCWFVILIFKNLLVLQAHNFEWSILCDHFSTVRLELISRIVPILQTFSNAA